MNNKIVILSDFDPVGSGYLNISIPLCNELYKLGYDIKALGIGYEGQEHTNNFSILRASNFNDVIAQIQNLEVKWKFDTFICALDIPHHEKLLNNATMLQKKHKYIGIMPVEAGPLCMSWATVLALMDKCFIISKYGTEQANQLGVNAEHIQIGIDCNQWRVPTLEEKYKLRQSLGIEDDVFVVLSVADNQERKNPHRLLETYAEFSQNKKTKLIFVTKEFNPAGGRLRDYAQELGIHKHFILIERGIPFKQLWGLYALSDVMLHTSKAEGLGLPILEAMATGLPIIATNCTAISELLADNRGLLADYEYQHRDCFGNGWRYWFSKKHGVFLLNQVYEHGFDTSAARKYVEQLTWDIPAKQIDKAIKEFSHE
jgi:glycosyltransferase involved in cell wall biosynthesis